tara:strand:+ start:506 stop:817 length:312 start_codon:yes stop_codon:yes gene_type:complete
MANLMKLMQAAKKMQKNVEATQEKLKTMRIIGSDPNQMVHIETDGQHRCLGVKLSETAMTLNQAQLEQAIQAALVSTHDEIQTLSQKEFSEIADAIQRESSED